MKFTISEVYSDGYSVFASVILESDKYDFSKISTFNGNNSQSVCISTSYAFGEKESTLHRDQFALNGKNITSVHIYVIFDENNIMKSMDMKTEEEFKETADADDIVEVK